MVLEEMSELYLAHTKSLFKTYCQFLRKYGYQRLLITSGERISQFRDDSDYPFKVNPYFKVWVPLVENPGSYVLIDVDQEKPHLLYFQPTDIWHEDTPLNNISVEQAFDVIAINTADEKRKLVMSVYRGEGETAYIGPSVGDVAGFNHLDRNPEKLLNEIDFQRAYKSDYEQACIRSANELAVKGHHAAAAAFQAGVTEYDIHIAYLQATGQLEDDLPYGSIIALNQNAAVLHYTQKQRQLPAGHRSFLIDAGAEVGGYASDISRTYARINGDSESTRFKELIEAMDQAQRDMVAKACPGKSYLDLHLWAHKRIAQVLVDFELVNGSVEACVATGVSKVFFPHGLGHLLGLQVHDRGGYLISPGGDENQAPENHPYLRLTRPIEVNQVFTIEPGLYFIPALLEQARQGGRGKMIHWDAIEKMMPYGGIRIEDNILVTRDGPVNLTRDAWFT